MVSWELSQFGLQVTIILTDLDKNEENCSGFSLFLSTGFATQLVPMFLAEITPVNLRGTFGTCHQLFITIGIFMGSVFGLREILGNPNHHGDDTYMIGISTVCLKK